MSRMLMSLIVVAALVALVLPTLAGTAPLPPSLEADDIGTWLGQVYQYWVEVFDFMQQETP